jgi:hypothetical protein
MTYARSSRDRRVTCFQRRASAIDRWKSATVFRSTATPAPTRQPPSANGEFDIQPEQLEMAWYRRASLLDVNEYLHLITTHHSEACTSHPVRT